MNLSEMNLPKMNILFVCTGNTCRSAMAEAIAKNMIEKQESYAGIYVQSAGVSCFWPSAASPQAVAVAANHGCDLSQFISKQITAEMMDKADYVFTMTRRHKQMLPQYSDKTFLLTAYAMSDPSAPDIPDPYGGSVDEYDQCFQVLEEQIKLILDKIKDFAS